MVAMKTTLICWRAVLPPPGRAEVSTVYRVTARCSCFLLVATFCAIWFSPAVAADDPSGSRRTVVYRNLKSMFPP